MTISNVLDQQKASQQAQAKLKGLDETERNEDSPGDQSKTKDEI